MRIHLIANMYPSESAPNYGVFVQNTENILKEAGFQIDKTVMTKKTSKMSKLVHYAIYYSKIIFKGLFNRYDFTYVHYASHNAIPLLLLKGLKKSTKIYTNVHGSDVVPEVPSQEKYQKWVKKLLARSNIVITPSNYYKELVSEKYHIDKDSIEVFPSGGVNSAVFYERDERLSALNELQLSTDYGYIGYVSRLDVGKGWDILLDSADELNKKAMLEKNKIIFVGDGKQKDAFISKVSEYGLNDKVVHFPLLPQKKLNAIYNSIDLFCFPTTRKGESLGLVGLEAMACGTPIIGSAIGGLLDYIEEGENGYFFEPGSSQELSAKIIKFYSLSNDERFTMKRNAKLKAKEYDVSEISGHLKSIFNNKQ
ncbi:glycosyltransferase family 4 protein [Metabacillus idriensis]|uniref:glycosyltransferase family 4 protein n=1 Tax=Metabacillus idriensis TaxID=324768 RepID=UPI0017496600|nr:glycosyltransferase family 4 protein [Metabacillus idriensis]